MDIIKKNSIYFLVIQKKNLSRNKFDKNGKNNLFIKTFLKIIIIFAILGKISPCEEQILYFRKINFASEIIIKIKGEGEQQLLNSYFSNTPDEIYVNGEYTSTKVNKVNAIKKIILLKWFGIHQ